MINYASIIEILRSDKYVDKTGCFSAFLPFRHETLDNCSGTGSSLFVKTMACFLDNTIDTKDVFRHLQIGRDETLLEKANTYSVLYLDFTDFDAHNDEEAMEYLRNKMSVVYRNFYNVCDGWKSFPYDWRSNSDTLDMVEGIASDHVLRQSFRKIMLQLRGYETPESDRKLAVLIDNMVMLETVAEKYGYSKAMDEFLKDFIVEDVYKYCDIFLQISDTKSHIEDPCFHSVRPRVHRSFSILDVDMRKRFPEIAVDRENQVPFYYDVLVPDTTDWDSQIALGRKAVVEAKTEEERSHREHVRQEKARYSIDLLPTIPRLSPNMGIRIKHLDRHLPRYEALNTLLRELFAKAFPDLGTTHLYTILQKIDHNILNVKNVGKLEEDLKHLSAKHPFWRDVSVNTSWGHWVQVTCRRKVDELWKTPATPGNIKVYAYIGGGTAQDVFIDSIRHLLTHAKQIFAAKLAIFERADQLCYWIDLEDYPCLEHFFEPFSGLLEESMPFVAYKGKLGISKEFPGMDDSHNLVQAHILSDYFKTGRDASEVDLEDMYNNYIAKWNADVFEEKEWGFKSHSVLSFLVVLDTLDAILKGNGINGQSLLFSNERNFWETLAESRCWADVNESFSSM